MKSSAGPQKYNVNLIKFLNLITKKKKVWQDTHKKEKYLRFQMKNQPNKYLVPGKIISVAKKKIELRFGNVLDQALNEVWNQENNRTKSED